MSGHLFIAITSNRGEKPDAVTDAIEAAQHGLARMGWRSTRVTYGSADLEDSRNVLASEFHSGRDYTHALFLDDDLSWGPGSVERLVSHPVDFVLGAYPRRAEGEGYSVRTIPGPVECVDPTTGKPHPLGIAKVAGGPGGMMRLTRAVMARFVEAFPDRWYHQPNAPSGRAYQFFEFDVIDHERISEDMNFCRIWRTLGGEVWVDPHLTLHHHGRKTYSGRFADHLRELGRLVEPEKVQRIPLVAANG